MTTATEIIKGQNSNEKINYFFCVMNGTPVDNSVISNFVVKVLTEKL